MSMIGASKGERTTAMGLWTDADGMRVAAEILAESDNRKVFDATYYLFGHGIEVALKSFLLAAGAANLDVLKKEVGHDLSEAARRAIQVRNSDVSELIEQYRIDLDVLSGYYKAKEFEYRVTGFKRLPHYERLVTFLRALLRMTRSLAAAAK